MLSLEYIQNEVLTITSEHPSSENQFDRKFQANIFSCDQYFENQDEELINLKVK